MSVDYRTQKTHLPLASEAEWNEKEAFVSNKGGGGTHTHKEKKAPKIMIEMKSLLEEVFYCGLVVQCYLQKPGLYLNYLNWRPFCL